MMKKKTAIFCVLMLLPLWVEAEDDDNRVTTTLEVQGGKLIREKQEIEVYDYHSGTFYSVHVYREPDKSGKTKLESVEKSQSSQQTRP